MRQGGILGCLIQTRWRRILYTHDSRPNLTKPDRMKPQPTHPYPIKLCGMTRLADVQAAAQAGAHWVGVIQVAGSSRCVDPSQAAVLLAAAREAGLTGVLLLANPLPAAVVELVAAMHPAMVQLHGGESPVDVAAIRGALNERGMALPLIKALAVDDALTPAQAMAYAGVADWLLLDRPKDPDQRRKATIAPAEWAAANPLRDIPWLLAGGLTVENVAAQVALGRPHGVDVASGIEADPQQHPGVKDLAMMQRFVQNASAALVGLSP